MVVSKEGYENYVRVGTSDIIMERHGSKPASGVRDPGPLLTAGAHLVLPLGVSNQLLSPSLEIFGLVTSTFETAI